MNPKRRPPTSWMRRCMSSVVRAGKLEAEAAQKICAGNWWHQAGPEAKAEIVKKYAATVPRASRSRMLRAQAAQEKESTMAGRRKGKGRKSARRGSGRKRTVRRGTMGPRLPGGRFYSKAKKRTKTYCSKCGGPHKYKHGKA